jgi:ribosomal protein L32
MRPLFRHHGTRRQASRRERILGRLADARAVFNYWRADVLADDVPRPGDSEGRIAATPGLATMPGVHAGPGHHHACPNCGRPAYDGKICGACGWGYGWQPAHEAAVAAIFAPGQLPVTLPPDDDSGIMPAVPRGCGQARRAIWQPPPNVSRPGHGAQRDAATAPIGGHETAGPGYPDARQTRPGQREGRAFHGLNHAQGIEACPNCGRPGWDGTLCGRCGWGYGYQPAYEAQIAAVYAPGLLDRTDPAPPPESWLSPPRSGLWLSARPRVRIPVADTALDVFTGEQARWLRELLADGLGGHASVDEYLAAARRAS